MSEYKSLRLNKCMAPEVRFEGTKFKTIHIETGIPEDSGIEELSEWCRYFGDSGLAPLHTDALSHDVSSYGNLSFRTGENSFIITASGSNLGNMSEDDFFEVKNVDAEKRVVYVHGAKEKEPSSESMLHASIYRKNPGVNAVFHGHCKRILDACSALEIPVTENFENYGTPELVKSVLGLMEKHPSAYFIIMKDHGFVSMGKDMESAGNLAVEFYRKSSGTPERI